MVRVTRAKPSAPSKYSLAPSSGNLGMEPARLAAQNNQDLHSLFLEAPMKNSTKDQAEGTLHEVKGKVKEQVGKTTNNPRLQDEGTDEKVAGKIQKKAGQIEKVFDNYPLPREPLHQKSPDASAGRLFGAHPHKFPRASQSHHEIYDVQCAQPQIHARLSKCHPPKKMNSPAPPSAFAAAPVGASPTEPSRCTGFPVEACSPASRHAPA